MRFPPSPRHVIMAFAALASALILQPVHAQVRAFEITLENLTSSAPSSGQPFSPPVFFMHDATATPWQVGDFASFPLRQVAEEGDNAPLLDDLGTQVGLSVRQIWTPTLSPLLPGQSLSLTVSADAAHPLLSSVWMLSRTNDGFSGIAGLDLFAPNALGVYDLIALDAGTEVNNELADFLPAFFGILNDPEGGVITPHTGIRGDADAPASWNFSNPVARLTVRASSAPEPGSLSLLVFAGSGTLLGIARRRPRA